MKLQLLLVLAVAALVPSLSDSRVISVCELKDKLDKAISQSSRHLRHRDNNLAKIICELKRMSNLNTSVVIVEGNRQPKTTNQPMINPSAPGGTNGPAGTFAPTAFAANSTAAAATAADNSTAAAAATAAAATAADNSTAAAAATAAAATAADNSTAAAATGAVSTTASVNASAPVSTNATAPSGIKRHKRSADDSNHESGDEEKQGDVTEGKENDDDSSKEQGDSSDDDDDDDSEEGNYGIFQLTDSHACDSGYHLSRNECQTDCSAFTDDDITDDIECFVGQGYWRSFLEDISDQCGNPGDIFSQCA